MQLSWGSGRNDWRCRSNPERAEPPSGKGPVAQWSKLLPTAGLGRSGRCQRPEEKEPGFPNNQGILQPLRCFPDIFIQTNGSPLAARYCRWAVRNFPSRAIRQPTRTTYRLRNKFHYCPDINTLFSTSSLHPAKMLPFHSLQDICAVHAQTHSYLLFPKSMILSVFPAYTEC